MTVVIAINFIYDLLLKNLKYCSLHKLIIMLSKPSHSMDFMYSFSIPASSYSGSWGGWSIFQLPLGERQCTIWTVCPSITGPTRRQPGQTTKHTDTRFYCQFRVTSYAAASLSDKYSWRTAALETINPGKVKNVFVELMVKKTPAGQNSLSRHLFKRLV